MKFIQNLLFKKGEIKIFSKGGQKMDNLWLIFWWTGPIGVGIFLLCLGGMIYFITKANALKKSKGVEGKEKM